MKNLTLLMLLAVLIGFTACEKDKTIDQNSAESSFEFKIEQTNFFKGTNDDVPVCLEISMDYVVFEINGTIYTTDIYLVSGELLTEVIKLPVGDYSLTSFLVYNVNGTPNDLSDDILVKASPSINSEYWDLMTNPLNLDFTVEAFYKKQIEIDVLCFEDLFYESFGFTWFEINDIRIERQCFFGDICTGKLGDFAGSLYANQPEGIQMDMPAIFQIRIYKDGEVVPFRTFDNTAWLGVGSCLEVYWPNNLNVDETFVFELWILLPSGPGFDYQHINTWIVQDEIGPDAGYDGVVDFVIGTCQYDDADYQFPFWMDLPTDSFTMTTGNSVPGSAGTYFDLTLSGVGAGFDIGNETYGIWCGDINHTLYLGTTYYDVMAYNSLSNTLPMGFPLSDDEIVYVNYLFNHLPDLIPGWTYENPTDYDIVQDVIWAITDTDDFTPTGQALAIYITVMANGANYEVPPGGWAGIVFWMDNGGDPQIQLIFTVVDP